MSFFDHFSFGVKRIHLPSYFFLVFEIFLLFLKLSIQLERNDWLKRS